MLYEYSISMIWHSKESTNEQNSSFTINPEFINGFAIISDYNATNMPIAYATLTLNKTERDKIIKEAKTAYFVVYIMSIALNGTDPSMQTNATNTTSKYSGKCVYFIDEDINYNKELDYPEKTSTSAVKANNDVLITFSVGLMWDNCIERNKKTSNDTILETTMFNAVLKQLQNTPLLIEPFKYNDTIDQLIVPPKDSLSKAIKFFNDIKVFYDTQYRFFIDPDCTYLISSSGNPTKRKGERFVNWLFNVRAITEPEALKHGMEFDQNNKCYYADVIVKDTYYTIDNDTNKLFNELKTIIDPNVENTPPLLDAINQAMSSVNKLTSDINSSIKDTISDIQNIPSSLNNFSHQFINDASKLNFIILGDDLNPGRKVTRSNYTDKSLSNTLTKLNLLKNNPPTGGDNGTGNVINPVSPQEWASRIQPMIDGITVCKNNISNGNTKLQKAPTKFKNESKDINSVLNGVTNIPGCLNCVTPINANDNIDNMNTKAIKLKNKSISIQASAKLFENDLISTGTSVKNSIKEAIDILNGSLGYSASELWEESFPPVTNENGQSSTNTTNPNPFPDIILELSADNSEISKYIGIDDSGIPIIPIIGADITPMVYMCQKYSDLCKTPNKAIESIMPNIKNVKNRAENIKSSALGAWNSIQNIGKSAQQSLDKITKLSKEISNKIKNLDFNIKSLPDLQKNINTIKDISKIGMLGVSMFKVNLSISGGGRATGEKIIKVKNDNNNIVKNIKSEIETYSNKISISKSDLDIDTFTINKRYVIKNYAAHSKKNGVFILIKKSDFFIRAGNRFKVSSQLEFAKVADEIDEKGNVKASVDTKQEVRNMLYHAESIIKLANGKISLNDASTIIGHAIDIQKSYDKMSKNGSSSPLGGTDIDKLIIH